MNNRDKVKDLAANAVYKIYPAHLETQDFLVGPYIGYCLTYEVFSQGKTPEHALKETIATTEFFLLDDLENQDSSEELKVDEDVFKEMRSRVKKMWRVDDD